MAITYTATGAGSDIYILAKLISEHNRRRYILTDTTVGLVGETRDILSVDLNTSSTDYKKSFEARIEDKITEERNRLKSAQQSWVNEVNEWLRMKMARDLGTESTDPSDIIRDLIDDMVANSKSVDATSSGAIAVTGTHVHMAVSKVHAGMTFAKSGTVTNVEYFGDIDGETITFRAVSPQNSAGQTTFAVFGAPAGEFGDNEDGWGDLGSFTTQGWNTGKFDNPGGETAANDTASEIAAKWRAFTNTSPFAAAPNVSAGLASRVTTAGQMYHGGAYFQLDGDGAITKLYLAQLMNNPLQNANTDAWGSTVNTSTVEKLSPRGEGFPLFFSFYYYNVPATYTLKPFLRVQGTDKNADVDIISITTGSASWKRYVGVIMVDAGDLDGLVEAGIILEKGGAAIADAINIRVDLIQCDWGTKIGNFWFYGQPSITPVANMGEEVFTISRATLDQWQTFFARTYDDRFGQAHQLPSDSGGAETEADSLIPFGLA